MFSRVAQIFSNEQEDMSFGWYVPLFSLYVLWTQRKELVQKASKPSWAGFLACIPFYALALLGTRGLQVRFEQLGFIGLCVTVPWAFYGRQFAKCFFFPAIYLLFTIPLSTFLDAVTIYLRLLASGTALALLRGFGIDAVQNGTAIISQGANPFSVDVAEPCSGLRSLFALMALTAAYSWYTLKSWPRRIALFACSVPLAVLGNVARIISICVIASSVNPKFALGFYHDYSGYIVFAIAISLMVAIGELMAKSERGKKKEAGEENGVEVKAEEGRGGFSGAAVFFAVVLSAVGIFQSFTPPSKIMSAPQVALPSVMEGAKVDDVKYCHDENCARMFYASMLEKGKEKCLVCGGKLFDLSLGEKTILPGDTVLLKKSYTDEATDFRYLVSAVVGSANKSSIHRPELCLPAQGFMMSSPVNFTAAGRPFRAIEVKRAGVPPTLLVYTFFNQRGYRTASHTSRIMADVWGRSVHNRIDRWVMLTMNVSSGYSEDGVSTKSESDMEKVKAFIDRFYSAGFTEGGAR